MTHRLEDMAMEMAALPEPERVWVLARAKALLAQRRAVGARLTGQRDDPWARLITGDALLYDQNGDPLMRVRHVDKRRDDTKNQTNIYITGTEWSDQ